MITDHAGAPPGSTARSPLRTAATLAAGLVGGCALGIAARAWMRLISDDPEFTWSGTLFIVGGFTIFGLAQSIVAIARRRQPRRWQLTIVRAVGAVAMLPLFVAAGGVMLPTVLGGGLARARTHWRPVTRVLWLLLAAGPVLFVGLDLVDSFGWSLHTLAGFAAMLAVYTAIIWATRFTFAPQADGWRLSRRAKLLVPGFVALSVSVLLLVNVGFG